MAQTAAHQCDDDHAETSGQGSHGKFCWNELMTRDAERAQADSTRTPSAGRFEPMPMEGGGTYWMRQAGRRSRSPASSSSNGPEFDGVPESWMSYLAVDDVDKRVEKAVKAGRQAHEADLRCARAWAASRS